MRSQPYTAHSAKCRMAHSRSCASAPSLRGVRGRMTTWGSGTIHFGSTQTRTAIAWSCGGRKPHDPPPLLPAPNARGGRGALRLAGVGAECGDEAAGCVGQSTSFLRPGVKWRRTVTLASNVVRRPRDGPTVGAVGHQPAGSATSFHPIPRGTHLGWTAGTKGEDASTGNCVPIAPCHPPSE